MAVEQTFVGSRATPIHAHDFANQVIWSGAAPLIAKVFAVLIMAFGIITPTFTYIVASVANQFISSIF